MKREFQEAFRDLETNKAQELDLIVAELIHVIEMLFKLIRGVYETGEIPNDNKVIKNVTISKIVGSDKGKNYRTISLTTHASNILNTIIKRRIKQTKESSLHEDQSGLRNKRGTRETLLALPLIPNSRQRVAKLTFIAHVDLDIVHC